jgi:hypothetical protein
MTRRRRLPVLPLLVGGAAIAYLVMRGHKTSTHVEAAHAIDASSPPEVDPLVESLAASVVADLNQNGINYDRTLMTQFQNAMPMTIMIERDGEYGPLTAATLAGYRPDAPPPFPGTTSVAGASRDFGIDADLTQGELAHAIHMETDPMTRRKLVAAFQRGERLTVHGWIDPETRAAMSRYRA